MEAEQLLTNLVGASPLLMTLAPFYYVLKGQITKGMVSSDDLEKTLTAFKLDIEKDQRDDKNYLHTLDKRTQENAKDIAEIRGRLDK